MLSNCQHLWYICKNILKCYINLYNYLYFLFPFTQYYYIYIAIDNLTLSSIYRRDNWPYYYTVRIAVLRFRSARECSRIVASCACLNAALWLVVVEWGAHNGGCSDWSCVEGGACFDWSSSGARPLPCHCATAVCHWAIFAPRVPFMLGACRCPPEHDAFRWVTAAPFAA